MPDTGTEAKMTVVGLLKMNSSTFQDGMDYEELRTVRGLQKIKKVRFGCCC
jgi:hypothetical protein